MWRVETMDYALIIEEKFHRLSVAFSVIKLIIARLNADDKHGTQGRVPIFVPHERDTAAVQIPLPLQIG